MQHVHYYQNCTAKSTKNYDKNLDNGFRKNGNSNFENNFVNKKFVKNEKREFSHCENISIPLGICSIPNNITLPTITNQNFDFILLDGGSFNNKIKSNSNNNFNEKMDNNTTKNLDFLFNSDNLNNNNNNNNSNNNNNNNCSNNTKINSNLPSNRFLVFPSLHISLSSTLPLILTYSTNNLKINNDHKDAKNYLKNVKFGELENTKNISNKDDIPPISALFSRDLCRDLLAAVNHCINWYDVI